VTTTTPKEDGNGDADEALLWLCFEQLSELAKTDPEQARALAQAMIELIREFLEELP